MEEVNARPGSDPDYNIYAGLSALSSEIVALRRELVDLRSHVDAIAALRGRLSGEPKAGL